MLRVGDLDRAINFYEKVTYLAWTGNSIVVFLFLYIPSNY
jgi:predicted enzyme related to lactoylglutathione lyase